MNETMDNVEMEEANSENGVEEEDKKEFTDPGGGEREDAGDSNSCQDSLCFSNIQTLSN